MWTFAQILYGLVACVEQNLCLLSVLLFADQLIWDFVWPVDSGGISREVKRFPTFSSGSPRKNGRAFAYEGLLCAFFSLWEINNSGILFGFWGSPLYLRPIGFPTGKHRILAVNLWLMPLAWGLPLPPPPLSGNRRAREIALKFSFTVPVS